ncbi:MAG: beta-ketoacyl-ACP synthase 3 [Clostridiales bacterium]|jgi:3-oxoacyl-[acyl-carrier-protein] synthase-3|nr:beta-ketoacyl-ACP synthase 3 [Eubacteriales bacterium]MDD4711050.1 beta-ketoacyl-ACP synthase 3 [Eubacteriales bacterium]NLO14670.1 beta-ketoacyl-ACP synthase 3 [Clostridiales bacterium]
MSFSIWGTGSALPEKVVTNNDLSAFLDTSDEWVSSRTGIRERRVMTHETLTDLAVRAAQNAMTAADTKPDDLTLILCATVTGEYRIPSLACQVQALIGAHCPAMDINAACSGFLYALDTAAAYFARDPQARILLVAADGLSSLADWRDRSVCVLFGDGAGAVVLGEGDDLKSIRLRAKGDAGLLSALHPRGNSPYRSPVEQDEFVHMDGQKVYRSAVSGMTEDLQGVVAQAGLQMADVDFVLIHQANLRILDAIAARLTIPRDKYLANIDRVGNTSAASIPILLDEMCRKDGWPQDCVLALAAFGGGATGGACVIRWHTRP